MYHTCHTGGQATHPLPPYSTVERQRQNRAGHQSFRLDSSRARRSGHFVLLKCTSIVHQVDSSRMYRTYHTGWSDSTTPGTNFGADFIQNMLRGTLNENGGFGKGSSTPFHGRLRRSALTLSLVVEKISFEVRPRGCVILQPV